MSFVARLDPRRWARVRALVFRRDGYRCRSCGRPGRLECDHIVPLHADRKQDPYAVAGLQALCRGCHIEKSRTESRKPPSAEQVAWRALVAELTGTNG